MVPKDVQSAAGVQKHRACDECRSRKLACSKEATGCSRCLREGIACHYSPQKPMGRPRKRRLVDETSPDEEAVPVQNVAVSSINGAYNDRGAVSSAPIPPDLNLSLSFLDEPPTSNLDYLDLLPYGYHGHDNAPFDPQIVSGDGSADDGSFSFALNGGVDLLGGINFDEGSDSNAASMSKDISDSLQRYWQSQNVDPNQLTESCLSSDQSNSAGSPHDSQSSLSSGPPATPKAIPSIACGCLSNLYFALDSLARLPPDITGTIRVARHATRIAHNVIRCPTCGDPLIDDPCRPPPIQAIQSLMCLAALVPSACNAYASILEKVDQETEDAKAQNRSIWFSFTDIGGLWGTIAEGHGDCPRMAAFNNRDMAPDLWRTTMRAILRLDVYGFGEPPEDVPAPSFRQYGLRDVIKQLEERSRRRHDTMDQWIAEGKMPHHSQYVLGSSDKPVPPEKRHCIQVLEAARIALNNLVIA